MTKTCFKVTFRDCDRNLACCRGMLAHVDKVNLDSTAACAASKNNIRNITVNGKWWPSWNTYKHDQGEAEEGWAAKGCVERQPGAEVNVVHSCIAILGRGDARVQ